MSRGTDLTQTMAALRAAKALEARNRAEGIETPPEPTGPAGATLRFCERLLGLR